MPEHAAVRQSSPVVISVSSDGVISSLVQQSQPKFVARQTASSRLCSSSFAMMRRTCVFTVVAAMPNFEAISASLLPPAISRSTSSSRRESGLGWAFSASGGISELPVNTIGNTPSNWSAVTSPGKQANAPACPHMRRRLWYADHLYRARDTPRALEGHTHAGAGTRQRRGMA